VEDQLGEVLVGPSKVDQIYKLLGELKEEVLGDPRGQVGEVGAVMLRAITEFEKSGEIKLRRVAKVIGVLVSVKEAWSPALVFSRAGFRTLQQAQTASWGTKVMPDPQLLEDLILTTKLLATGGKRLIQHTEKVTEVWSDASPTGWACAIQELEARGVWVGQKVELSTNRRELLGFWRGLLALEREVRGKVLKWIGDNTTSIIWFWKGARDASVGQLMKQIWVWLAERGVNMVEPRWVKSEDMKMNALSRWENKNDWRVADWVFQLTEEGWGPHNIDRFADKRNSKCKRWNSRYWTIGGEAADAFIQDWRGDNNWLVPPLKDIPRVLMYLKEQNPRGTILVSL
jgi:hypothetical protein